MNGVVRQLYDYDGSNLFPRTKPSAFVSDLYDSSATGITTIGELIDSSVPGEYRDPVIDASVPYEPEFVYRIPATDTEITGGSYGTLKAVKLTEVSALHFDAKLTENLDVTNIVGIAGMLNNPHCPNGVYPAGTLLETIIIDMLTADMTTKDIERILPGIQFTVEITDNGVDFSTVTDGSVITAEEGVGLKLRYSFAFTDGRYLPVYGYDASTFTWYNYTSPDASMNLSFFVSSPTSPYLNAGSVPKVLTLKTGNTVIYTQNYPDSSMQRMDVLEPVTIGQKVYDIILTYANGQSVPFKSNGQRSGNTVTEDSSIFTFTINGVHAEVYDVVATVPFINDDHVEDFEINTDSSRSLIAVSKWDLENNASTGIWTGDTVTICTKKLLDPAYTLPDYTPEIDPEFSPESAESYGPIIAMSRGYFTPGTGYADSLFYSNNSEAVEFNSSHYLYSDCNFTSAPLFELLYNNATVIDSKLLPYASDKLNKKVLVKNGNIDCEYYFGINVKDSSIFNTSVSMSGDYKVCVTIPYTSNTIVPKKSNDSSSNITILDGSLVVSTSNTFNVKKEVDVSVTSPRIVINQVRINGTVKFNGESIAYDQYIGKPATIAFSYTDGYFSPENAVYTASEFNTNNSTSNSRLYASCVHNNDYALRINGNTTSYTCSSVNNEITNVIFDSYAGNEIRLTVYNQHTASAVVPKKRSTRPSDKNISSGVTSCDDFILKLIQQDTTYHFILVTTTDTSVNDTIYNNVTEVLNSGGTIHYNDSEIYMPSPYIKEDSINGVGANRKVFVIAAPIAYKAAKIYSGGSQQPITFTLVPPSGDSINGIPYSNSDNTKYRLFKYRCMTPSGYAINKIELTQ